MIESALAELSIGRRVAFWRRRRKMSQQIFADRLGKSKSWVDKVERGVRNLDRYTTIHAIADLLQIDVSMLLGTDPVRSPDQVNCIDQVQVDEIRAALELYNGATLFWAAPTINPKPLPEIRKALAHGWSTFYHARYGILARLLPRLLRDTITADAVADEEHRCEAAGLLSQLYQLTGSTLRKLGEAELARVAHDRAIESSARSRDPLWIGVSAARISSTLLSLGRARPALELAIAVGTHLSVSDLSGTEPEQVDDRLSVYGHVVLAGSLAAARIGDSATVRDLLGTADAVAAEFGRDDNRYTTCFGPTNVQLYKVAAAVDLGEGGLAVRTYERSIDHHALSAMLPERRAQLQLDLARAHAQEGNIVPAAEALLCADEIAPSEIRCRPLAHQVLSEVLRRTRGTPPPLVAQLATNCGIGV